MIQEREKRILAKDQQEGQWTGIAKGYVIWITQMATERIENLQNKRQSWIQIQLYSKHWPL